MSAARRNGGLKALLADKECTLAALVVTACEHGMLPDWAL